MPAGTEMGPRMIGIHRQSSTAQLPFLVTRHGSSLWASSALNPRKPHHIGCLLRAVLVPPGLTRVPAVSTSAPSSGALRVDLPAQPRWCSRVLCCQNPPKVRSHFGGIGGNTFPPQPELEYLQDSQNEVGLYPGITRFVNSSFLFLFPA